MLFNQFQFRRAPNIKPFWTVPKDEESFMDWVQNVFNEVGDFQRALYKSDVIKDDFFEGKQSIREHNGLVARGKKSTKSASVKVCVNRTREVILIWVNKIMQASREIEVSPANSQEYNDRMAAKMSQQFLDYLWYTKDSESAQERLALDARVQGDGVLVVEYDPFDGDMVPNAEQAITQPGQLIPILDAEGNQRVTDDGDPLEGDYVARVGEVGWRNTPRRRMILQPGRNSPGECDWMIEVLIKDTAEVLAKNPQVLERDTTEFSLNDIFTQTEEMLSDFECYVYRFYHKGTAFLDAGMYVEFTAKYMLNNLTMVDAFGHRELPVVWLQDQESREGPYGISLLDQLMVLQVLRNGLTSILYTNVAIGASAHWLIHKSAKVDPGSLTNTFGVIPYSGNIKPEIVQYRTVSPDIERAIDKIDQAIDQIAQIQDIARGVVPKRMDSGAGVAELAELDEKRAHSPLRKHSLAVKKKARLCLATAGHFYRPDDGRTMRIVGENSRFSIEDIDSARLGGPFDIRVGQGSNLSSSKAGRVQQIKELLAVAPDLFPREQILDLLELGSPEKYLTIATSAVAAQERENELMAEGKIIPEPVAFQDHEVHWFSLVKFMQAPHIVEDLPEEVLMQMIFHGKAHEMFLIQRLNSNPIFKQRFMTMYPMFPYFLEINSLPMDVPASPEEGYAPSEVADSGAQQIPQ